MWWTVPDGHAAQPCRHGRGAHRFLLWVAALGLTVALGPTPAQAAGSGLDAAEAIPAFARKYNLSCNVCHTREPRLNPFGQRFQENGYQLPGTEDGGEALKTLLGGPGPLSGATLDQVSNYLAVRLRAEVQQSFLREETVPEEPDFRSFPNVINIFLAGSATRNVSFYFETEFAPPAEEGEAAVEFERAMLILTNLGRHQLANLRIGRIDPSAFFAFPTHRQQMNPIFPVAHSEDFPPEIDRIPVLPMAFAAKMFGLTRGPERQGEEGFSILPFEPFFFNSPATSGAMFWGRPFGDNFLYQIGMAQDETAEDEPDVRFDPYGMLRFDFLLGPYTAFQFSGFYYYARDAARPTLAPMGNIVFAEPVDWQRFGAGARLHHKFFDLYGTVIWDEIDDVVFPGAPLTLSEWDTQGLGASVEADWVLHQNWFLGVRWDFMDPGGLVRLPPGLQGEDPDINQDASLLGGILKFYPVPNVGLYARTHYNLFGSEQLPTALGGAEHPARNVTLISALGVDMAF